MNEIKFRAYDKRTKQTTELLGFKYVGETQIQLFYLDEDGDSTSCTCEKEFIVLMQYTGLKDKNGKEIYKGDVVRYIDYYYDQSGDNDVFINTGIVEYDDGSIAFYFTDRATATMEEVLDEDIEVIGNIHDNLKLLQEVDKL